MKNGNVFSDINKIFVELKKFSPSFYSINPPVDNKLVERFEKEFQLELPADYKYLLSQTNGFEFTCDEIYGITWNEYGEDLVNVYKREHFDVAFPQFKYLIPFCPDGGGNFYCFDTKVKTNNGNSNNIVFWHSNYEYTEDNQPEITHQCLADFINECILEWTMELYNYDGSKK